ncbi:hypothetical protein [Gramella sp. AN32]|nr:hypothetical protein [Gramella sp. AN32]
MELPKDITDEMKIRFDSGFDLANRILTEFLDENEYLNHERIIRCVIYLSDGIQSFRHNLSVAKSDPRDVMLFAEYEQIKRVRDFNKSFYENGL